MTMYAIVESGGKQYRAEPGQMLNLEKLDGKKGDTVELTKVLLVADGERLTVGTPVVPGAKVVSEIVRQGRGPKIRVLKFKRRKNYRRHIGHRQAVTMVKVKEIVA
jgi:large subunit ribosomal protein L21